MTHETFNSMRTQLLYYQSGNTIVGYGKQLENSIAINQETMTPRIHRKTGEHNI